MLIREAMGLHTGDWVWFDDPDAHIRKVLIVHMIVVMGHTFVVVDNRMNVYLGRAAELTLMTEDEKSVRCVACGKQTPLNSGGQCLTCAAHEMVVEDEEAGKYGH